MTFSIDNPEGGCNNPLLGKYFWEKPSGEQGLKVSFIRCNASLKSNAIKDHLDQQTC